jgi:hypothetical protein
MNEDDSKKKERPTELNFAWLVESLVPHIAELLATLASGNPLRMHFADIANKTLLDMVEVLRQDGVSQEAIAASLGLTINGFRSKMKLMRARYREPNTSEDAPIARTLLERVYAFIDESASTRGVTASAIATQFKGVKADSLQGVLHFLVKSGLLAVSGDGRSRVYRAVNRPGGNPGFVDAMILLFREGPMTLMNLVTRMGLPLATCEEYLERLREAKSLVETTGADGSKRYSVTEYYVPVDATEGYEAALFDHLATVIAAVCKKVRGGVHVATMRDQNGGATYAFDVHEDDPTYLEIVGHLSRMRAQLAAWHHEVTLRPQGTGTTRRVTIYLGQMVEDLE